MTDKLSILVRVDLDSARAQVSTRGHVTTKSIQALYVVVKRANALRENLDLEIDMTHAWVEPDALEQLHKCSRTRHLPVQIDPYQADCKLRVVPPSSPVMTAPAMTLSSGGTAPTNRIQTKAAGLAA